VSNCISPNIYPHITHNTTHLHISQYKPTPPNIAIPYPVFDDGIKQDNTACHISIAGTFISQDIVEAFVHTAYKPTEDSIKLLCKLKGVNNLFHAVVTRQMKQDMLWLGDLAKGRDKFRAKITNLLTEGSYDHFFVGMHTFRYISQVQDDALRAFHSNTMTNKGSHHSCVVVASMQYHRRDIMIQRFRCAVQYY